MERLIRQEKLAAVGKISASIAHELRNPLGAVKQASYYLNRLHLSGQLNADNPKVREHLALIEAEINTTDRVIRDLLDTTRMRPCQPEKVDLSALIMEAADRTEVKHCLQFRLNIEPENKWIWADPVQLRQVLLNLFTNAMHACLPDGLLTVRAGAIDSDQWYEILVQDNGRGIEPEVIDQVFEPLYTSKAKGTGLGLSICRQIIENHEGRITLCSEPGQGTAVQILLPYHQPLAIALI